MDPCEILNPLTAQMDFFGTRPLLVWLGLTVLLLAIAWEYRRQLGPTVALAWGYFASYALFISEFPAGTYGCFQRAFEASAGQNFIEIVLLPAAIYLMPEKGIKWCWAAIFGMALIDIPTVWLHRNGLMVAPSFDLAFFALALPFAPWWLWLAALPTILAFHGSTALLILLAELGAYTLVYGMRAETSRERFRWLAAWGIGGLALSAFAAYHAQGGEVFTRHVRFAGYTRHLQFWLYGSSPLLPKTGPLVWPMIIFGTGPGSFSWISMMLSSFKPPLDLNLHCDWLQIATDTGLVGLGLFLAVVAQAVRAAWRDPQLLAALAGIAACMLTYHPLRFFPTMLLITLVARKALFPHPTWDFPRK